MLKESFSKVYDKFEMRFYRKVFEFIHEKDPSLTAVDAFCLEIIKVLGSPTISEFADFVNISRPNASYKVNGLIEKGYVAKENCEADRREYRLVLTRKFNDCIGVISDYENTVLSRIEERFTPEEIDRFDETLNIIADDLMPESRLKTKIN